jgi:hypothetical protein
LPHIYISLSRLLLVASVGLWNQITALQQVVCMQTGTIVYADEALDYVTDPAEGRTEVSPRTHEVRLHRQQPVLKPRLRATSRAGSLLLLQTLATSLYFFLTFFLLQTLAASLGPVRLGQTEPGSHPNGPKIFDLVQKWFGLGMCVQLHRAHCKFQLFPTFPPLR